MYLTLVAGGHRISDPKIRADLIQKAAASWINEEGRYDDTTATQKERNDFSLKVYVLKRDYADNMPYDDANEFLGKIAELSLSQEELSQAIAPKEISLDTQDSSTIAAAYGLDIFYFLKQEGVISPEIIQDFLLNDYSLEEMTSKCEKIRELLAIRIDDMRFRINCCYRSNTWTNGLTERDALNLAHSFITPQYMMRIKKEFDAAPLHGKGAIMQMVIDGHNWEEQFNTVANKLFNDAGELGDIGTKFLYNYINSREDSEKSFYLAAIYAAAQSKTVAAKDPSSPYSPEQRSLATGIRLFLENSGPAGVKLAQAMASYSGVPDFIRDEMQKAKNQADPPKRWKVFEWLKQSDQMDLLNHGKLGKLLGSASFFATFQFLDNTSLGKVVKILRGGSKALADNEFKIYKEMLDKMSSELSTLSSFKRLVDTAASMVDVEVNLDIGKKQLQDAKQLYPNKVTVDGTEFKLQVMDWTHHDENWAIMEKASGKDFKELSGPYQTTAAKAVFTTELANMLSGKRFDSDRHAGQYKFDEATNTIGIFDTGSLSIIEPTQKDQEILGRVLASTVLQIQRNPDANAGAVFSGDIDKAVAKYYAAEAQSGKPIPPYLSEFQRGLLALNDFYSEIPPKELATCFIQALNNGKNKLNPQIYQGFVQGMRDPEGPSLNAKLATIFKQATHDKSPVKPDAQAAQTIGRIVTNMAIENGDMYKALITLPHTLKQEKLSLEMLDSESGRIQFGKGAMKEVISKLDPANYSVEERRKVGAILYDVIQEGTKRKKAHKPFNLATVMAEQLAQWEKPGEYAKNIKNIVGLTSSLGLDPSLHDFKKAVVFGRLIDAEVQKGYSQALRKDHRTGALRTALDKVNPLNYIPQQTVKKIAKTMIKSFAPQCLMMMDTLRRQNISKILGNRHANN